MGLHREQVNLELSRRVGERVSRCANVGTPLRQPWRTKLLRSGPMETKEKLAEREPPTEVDLALRAITRLFPGELAAAFASDTYD